MEAQLNYLDLLVSAFKDHEKALDRLVAKLERLSKDKRSRIVFEDMRGLPLEVR